MMFPERLSEALDLMYQASFVEHKPVHEVQCLTALLEEIFGKEPTGKLLQRVKRPPCPQRSGTLMKVLCAE